MSSSFGNLYTGELDVNAAAVRNMQHVPQAPGQLDAQAHWSPDGTRLLIERTFVDLPTKWIIRDMATGEEKDVVPPALSTSGETAHYESSLSYYQPRWMPDGKSIFHLVQKHANPGLMFGFAGSGQEPAEVIVADLQTGNVRSRVRVGAMAWTADGKHLIYTSFPLSPTKTQTGARGPTSYWIVLLLAAHRGSWTSP